MQRIDGVTLATEQARQRQWQGRSTQFIDGRVVSGFPRARDECITGVTVQIKRR